MVYCLSPSEHTQYTNSAPLPVESKSLFKRSFGFQLFITETHTHTHTQMPQGYYLWTTFINAEVAKYTKDKDRKALLYNVKHFISLQRHLFKSYVQEPGWMEG